MSESLTGIRVLVAEDHDDTRDILEPVLRHLGAVVTTVSTATEAMALVVSSDIVLTDLSMAGKDGVWLLEQINQQPLPIPVIAVSGFAQQHEPRLAEAPFARTVLKPVDPWHLAGIIIEVLETA